MESPEKSPPGLAGREKAFLSRLAYRRFALFKTRIIVNLWRDQGEAA